MRLCILVPPYRFAVAALTLVSNAQIVPRANERLAAVLASGAPLGSDRMMTIGELRAAARSARAHAGPDAVARGVSYEVEIQKKYALAAGCVVLALAGAAIALRFPRGGVGLVMGASLATFSAYYVCLTSTFSASTRSPRRRPPSSSGPASDTTSAASPRVRSTGRPASCAIRTTRPSYAARRQTAP